MTRRAGAGAVPMALALLAAVACGGGTGERSSGPSEVAAADEATVVEGRDGVRTTEREVAGLPSLVMAPSDRSEGPWPLVVFVHGAGAPPEYYRPLLEDLAAAGHVVVAPAMPGSVDHADAQALLALPFQPGRVHQVIDAVTTGPERLGAVDPGRVAVAGHSLGGMTALAVGFHRCCADGRVDAVISIAGRLATFPGGAYGGGLVPVLLIHGEADDVVGYEGSVEALAAVGTSAHLLTVEGGDHGHYLDPGNEAYPAVRTAVEAFLASTVGGAPRGGATDLAPAGEADAVRLDARY